MSSANLSDVSYIPLRISLSGQPTVTNTRPGTATIHVTIANLAPSTIHLLRWQSPLDTKAVALGILKLKSTTTGELARCLDLKINRKLPDEGYFEVGDEDIVSLEAGGKVEWDIVAGVPEVALERGQIYEAWAEGTWISVWVESNEGVRKEDLPGEEEKLFLNGDARLMRAAFKSDVVAVQVS